MLAVVSEPGSLLGKCYCVGFNKYGELGLGISDPVETFTLIPKLNPVLNISAGQHISLFIDENKKLLSCGIGTLHGNASDKCQPLPMMV